MATIRCGKHSFENISAVVFDKDGTLANVEDYLCRLSRERIHQVVAALPSSTDKLAVDLMSAMGISEAGIDPAGLMAIASRSENEIAIAAYVAATGRGWIESKAIVKAAFDRAKSNMPTQSAQTSLLPGGRSLVTQLKSANIKVAIVSADSHGAVGDFIDRYDLACDIDWYCGCSDATPDVMKDKTAPGVLDYACQSLGSRPCQTLAIGDSMADFALAQQGAAGFIAMVGGWRVPPTIPGAEIIIHRLSQVECFD